MSYFPYLQNYVANLADILTIRAIATYNVDRMDYEQSYLIFLRLFVFTSEN